MTTMAHLQAGEDPELSKEADVDVMAVLRRALGPKRYRTVRGIEERSLSGALPLKDVSRWHATPLCNSHTPIPWGTGQADQ